MFTRLLKNDSNLRPICTAIHFVGRWWCYIFLMGFVSIGCSTFNPVLNHQSYDVTPKRVEIESVPFYPQDKYQCGPAAMSMVLDWSDADFKKEDLISEIFTPKKKGSLQPALVTAARRRGRLAYPISGMDELLAELSAGYPVVILQNVGLSWYPRWHYAVVIGYDVSDGFFLLHTGLHAKRKIPWSLFVRTWKRSDYWGLLVIKPSDLPASDEEGDYLRAVLGLEQARQWTACVQAYEAALKRWPKSLGAAMGLGNVSYILKDISDAEKAFRYAASIHPESGSAFNNLAHVIAEQGRFDEAMDYARKAVDLGGPNKNTFLRTLAEIKQMLKENTIK